MYILCKDDKITLLPTAVEAGGAESWFPVCNDYLGWSSKPKHRYWVELPVTAANTVTTWSGEPALSSL